MRVYNEHMKPTMTLIDIFKLFGLSKEVFELIPVRENEKLELVKFRDKVPVPVKGALDEPSTKIDILLQCYISKYRLDGYDLNSDMVYVTQSAGRLLRALFEDKSAEETCPGDALNFWACARWSTDGCGSA